MVTTAGGEEGEGGGVSANKQNNRQREIEQTDREERGQTQTKCSMCVLSVCICEGMCVCQKVMELRMQKEEDQRRMNERGSLKL